MDSTPGYVDTITGATGLTFMSNIAVRDALDKLESNNHQPSPFYRNTQILVSGVSHVDSHNIKSCIHMNNLARDAAG